MKKIKWVIISLILCIPFVVKADTTLNTVSIGDTVVSGYTANIINGADKYFQGFYYTGMEKPQVQGVNYYDIIYYVASKDKNGNVTYEKADNLNHSCYCYYPGRYAYSVTFPQVNKKNVRWLLKDKTYPTSSTATDNWYMYSGSLDDYSEGNSYTSSISYYSTDSYPTINVYEQLDAIDTDITCDKNHVKFGNTASCKIILKYEYDLYYVNFALSSDKYDISNLVVNDDRWSFKQVNNKYYLKFNYNGNQTLMGDATSDAEFKDGVEVASFDIAYDNNDDIETITDDVVLDEYDFTSDLGRSDGDDVNASITFDKTGEVEETTTSKVDETTKEETVVDNPKTGIVTFSYLLIPILVGLIVLIKNKNKLTIFKNR